MLDLVRHPEYNEITGFRFLGQPKDRLYQNNNLRKFRILFETPKILKSTEFINSTFFIHQSSFLTGHSCLFKRQNFFENVDGTFHNAHGQRPAGTFTKSHPEIQNRIQF